MTIEFKKVYRWPRLMNQKRTESKAKVPFDSTISALLACLKDLNCVLVTCGLGVDRCDLRLDGWPRASSRPKFPGVLIVADTQFGQILVACDTYSTWLHNIQAIISTLKSLRRIVSMGIVAGHDLYKPFVWSGLREWLANSPFSSNLGTVYVSATGSSQARPATPPPPPPPPPPPKPTESENFVTRVSAANWLVGETAGDAADVLMNERAFLNAYRQAARTLHPDVGGDPVQFRRLQNAKAAIERGAPWGR